MIVRLVAVAALVALMAWPSAVQAQTPRTGKLVVTVVDPSGAVVQNATVTLVGVDAAAKAATVAPVKTTDKGVATIDGLVPGRYSITAEFPGFELGLLQNVTIKTGDNKHVVVLPLRGLEAAVSVTQDKQAAAVDPRGSAFGSALTREQIEALSDDPGEMQQQLQDLVGGNGTIRINSFEGGELPPKSQIKSIHITRDAFAAENHNAGAIFVDIITQPGSGPLRANGSGNFQDGSMTGRSPFVAKKGPEQNRSYNAGVSGSLATNRASFSLNGGQSSSYNTPNVNVVLPSGNESVAANLRTQRRNDSVFGQFDYAITRDQTLRVWYSQSKSTVGNLGIGAYDLSERGYSSHSAFHNLRMQEAGPLGRRFFTNTRFDFNWAQSGSQANLEAPTIRVNDAFTSGGAQVAGERHSHDLRLMSDLDYVRGIHSVRAGIDLWGTWYRSDERSNYLGTYTFASLDDFNAGRPTFYTRRIGDPLISYLEAWLGGYLQDDVRVRKNLTLSLGVRYEGQTHLRDRTAIGPRAGVTWAPFKSGRTSIRTSWGIFYDWLSASTYEQTLRVDGFRQQELDIQDPTYPDPSSSNGEVPPINRYLMGAGIQMARNTRVNVGIDQTLTPKLRGSVSYSDIRSSGILRGVNLNAPVDGVLPDPAFGTIVEAVGDARSHAKSLSANLSYNVLAPSPAASQARFNWKRLNLNVFYTLSRFDNNSDGAFNVPTSGTLATEWGPGSGDVRHRISGGFSTSALKNFTANFNWNASSGRPYTILTGLDGNGDLIFNDRPAGVGRNTLRYPWWWQVAGSFSYSISFGRRLGAGGGGVGIMIVNGEARVAPPSDAPRYRMSFNMRIGNITNHYNYSGFSGIMTSPFFMKATSVNEVRRINFNMSFSF